LPLPRTPARRQALLSSLLLGLLAACVPQPAPPKPAPPPRTAYTEPPPPPHFYRRPRFVPRPGRKPAPPGTAAELEAQPPPPQEGELIGLDQSAAARLFGTASERSSKPPAMVWRYRSDACELDLYFYLDLKSGRMRTLHYAFKGDAGDTAKRQECLRAIVDRGRKSTQADAASAHR
jgi:hypothetical protein